MGYESPLSPGVGAKASHGPLVWLIGPDSILDVGDRVTLASGVQLVIGPGASIRIGDRSYINPMTRVLAAESVEIGADCAISWDVQIADFDGHTLVRDPPARSTAGVAIGDNVWIGAGARILKGVAIGSGAVVAAGAVVTRSIPARALVAGNPARVIRDGIRWKL